MTKTILQVKNLTINYHSEEGLIKAVENVNFSIKKGETIGLVGETGCGKSTVASAIMRILPPTAEIVKGEIIFKGRNLLELSEDEMRKIRGREIAMVYQDPLTSLNPVLTVGDQISEVLIYHFGMNKQEAKEKVIQLLKDVNIPAPERVVDMYPHELSGGMKQRVMIAMALASDPELLILDEPTTALDVTVQAQFLALVDRLQEKYNMSILWITHDLSIIAEMADKVAVMYAGHLVEYTSVESFFHKPLHPYSRLLLNAIPRIGISIEDLVEIPGDVPSLIDPPKGCRFSTRCPYVHEICNSKKPEQVEYSPNHFVACHLYKGGTEE